LRGSNRTGPSFVVRCRRCTDATPLCEVPTCRVVGPTSKVSALLLPHPNDDGDDQRSRRCVRDARALRAILPGKVRAGEVRHGLWVLVEGSGPPAWLEPVDVLPEAVHGAYDCCSGSYGSPGAAEGFKMNRARARVVVTARRTGSSTAISYSDDLFELRLGEEGTDGSRALV